MPFAYLRDPLFVTCFCAYWVHRALATYGMSTSLLRCYLNDLICIPFWVPILVWGLRKAGLRADDKPPQSLEIIVPLLVWSAWFEILLPGRLQSTFPVVADPADILCYSAGALLAVLFWRWHYRRRPVAESST